MVRWDLSTERLGQKVFGILLVTFAVVLQREGKPDAEVMTLYGDKVNALGLA